jgi:mRNA interferase MazF
MKIRRGDIVIVNLDPVIGSEQGKVRPAVVIQNDIGNEFSPVIIVAPITSQIFGKDYPINVKIEKNISGLEKDSNILLNQIRTVDKKRICKNLGSLPNYIITKVDNALKLSLGLN